jgi:hypothetical protein
LLPSGRRHRRGHALHLHRLSRHGALRRIAAAAPGLRQVL